MSIIPTVSKYSEEIAIEGTRMELSAKAEESIHRFNLSVREKMGGALQKAGKALKKVTSTPSEHRTLRSFQERIEPFSQRIQEEQATNQEKIDEEREALAWSTIERILGGYVRKKATCVKIASDTAQVLDIPSLCEGSSERPTTTPQNDPLQTKESLKPRSGIKKFNLHKIQLPSLDRFKTPVKTTGLPTKPSLPSPSLILDLELNLNNRVLSKSNF